MREETRLLMQNNTEEGAMEESYTAEELAEGCNHCGGVMRLYLGGYSCMMCGRTKEHSCENCQNIAVAVGSH